MTEDQTPAVRLLGKCPSGLFIVTASHQDKRAGYLASFVQQASFKPLLFSVACHPQRYPFELIMASKQFALNFIPEGDKILLKTFAKGHGPGEDPFAGVSLVPGSEVPLLRDSIGSVVLRLVDHHQPGDHVLLYGEPISGEIFDESLKPWVHTRKSALNY